MAEQAPKKVTPPPSFEVMSEHAGTHGTDVNESQLETKIKKDILGRILDKTKRKLVDSTKRLVDDEWFWRADIEGPDYLFEGLSGLDEARDYIWHLLGDPATEEDLERRLLEYVNRVQQHPNNEDFGARLPVIAFEQGQKGRQRDTYEHLHDERGMFIPLADRALQPIRPPLLRDRFGNLKIDITDAQAGMLSTYIDKQARMNGEKAA